MLYHTSVLLCSFLWPDILFNFIDASILFIHSLVFTFLTVNNATVRNGVQIFVLS